MKCLTCHGLITNGNCGCSTGTQGAASVNIDIMLRSRDAEIARLKAQIDEDNRVILAVREHNRQLRAALAANAELRAALEHWTHVYGAALKPPGADTYGEGMRDAKDQVRALLSRTDLGAGMMAVPREVLERAQAWLQAIMEEHIETCLCSGHTVIADLDALLKKGGG